MALSDFALSGVTGMETLLGNPTFTWKGSTFGCVPNTLNDEVKNNNKWFNENADFRMTVRLNQFSNGVYPSLNDYIYYAGKQLVITGIKKTPHNIFWVFICSQPTVNG